MTHYAGSCHCGNVRFEIETEFKEFTRCNCSICRKKNALMTLVPEARLRIVQGEDDLTLYQWNTKVAKHYFCKRCGIYVFHRKRALPDHYGVNVFCLDDADLSGVPIREADGRAMSAAD